MDPTANILLQTLHSLFLFLDFQHLLISNPLPFTLFFSPTLSFFPDFRLPLRGPSEAKHNLVQKVFDLPPFSVTPYERNFYLLDVFDVAGGKHHAKHTHPTFGEARPFGLRTQPSASPYDAGALMRGFQCDPRPSSIWGVDWKIEDHHKYRPTGAPEVHLRYTDLTRGASACAAEMWIVADSKEYWIPAVVTTRRSEAGNLKSTFVAVMEPYETTSKIRSVRRLDKPERGQVEVEVQLTDGSRDRLISRAGGVEWQRRDRTGRVTSRGEASGR